MTKHILDRSKPKHDSDLVQAVVQASKQMPHRETLALQRRTRMRASTERQAQFLRIAREEIAP